MAHVSGVTSPLTETVCESRGSTAGVGVSSASPSQLARVRINKLAMTISDNFSLIVLLLWVVER
jgi:hypothetical protein